MVRRALLLLVPMALLAGACSDDDPAIEQASSSSTTTSTTAPSSSSTTGAPATDGVPPASSTTTPPGEGTPLTGGSGTGDIDYTLAQDRSEFCYRITVRGLGEVSEAHVHRSDGEVVLGLQAPPADGTVDTCAATDALLIEEMAARPSSFYIDVHGTRGVLRASL